MKTGHVHDVTTTDGLWLATVKVHGTNAAMCGDGKEMWVQSRNRVLSMDNDNHGTHKHYTEHKSFYRALAMKLGGGRRVWMYGEWAGKGIQGGVGVSELPPQMYLYAVVREDELLDVEVVKAAVVELRKAEPVYHICEFPTWHVSLKDVLKVKKLTDAIEKECPVAAFFDVKGKVGEGLVLSNGWTFVKSKGTKHQAYRRPVSLKADVATVDEFVARATTVARLEQGVEEVGYDCAKKIPALIQWVVTDILAEEKETMAASKLTSKDVTKAISKIVVAFAKTSSK